MEQDHIVHACSHNPAQYEEPTASKYDAAEARQCTFFSTGRALHDKVRVISIQKYMRLPGRGIACKRSDLGRSLARNPFFESGHRFIRTCH